MSAHSLSTGKIEPATLRQLVLNRLGKQDPRVILGPKIGEDASVIDFGERALVVHSDPITGAVENVGWLAVNVCTNDIATRGVRPLWILTVLLLPENSTQTQLKDVMNQIDEAAKQLGVALVGGHSEVTSAVKHPVIMTTAIGEAVDKKFVRSSDAQVGDSLIVTKSAAIEGTAILAYELEGFLERKVGKETVQKAKQFIRMTSVVNDALTAVEAGGVHAMHDATEGGIAGGLQEIAWASNLGVTAYEDKIHVYAETETICKALSIDPLKTISSGTLIISADSKRADRIAAALERKGIRASIVGQVVDDRQKLFIVRKDGAKLNLSQPVKEELWTALEKRIPG